MVGVSASRDALAKDIKFDKPPHICVIEARFYNEIADMLLDGAKETIEAFGATYEKFTVPGSLEIPLALQLAAQSKKFDAFVVLGTVMRGGTTHYETVCHEANRGLTDVSLKFSIPVGNGILTVENKQQAIERADKTNANKGGGAVVAALRMLQIKNELNV